MTDVLGTPDEDPRSPALALTRSERRLALAVAVLLLLGVTAVVRGLPPTPTLLVASQRLEQVLSDGTRLSVPLPDGLAPAALLPLPGATVALLRPPGSRDGTAYLVTGRRELQRLGAADRLVPDTRGDRVWLARRTSGGQELTSYDGTGHPRGQRTALVAHDLLAVTPDGVLDDEVGRPGGSTPTLRADDGSVLRALPGPVQVLDVVGPRLLAVAGTCLQTCEARVWDLRDGSTTRSPLPSGLVVRQGALDPGGDGVLLAGRLATATQMSGSDGEAVLLRGRAGGTVTPRTVTGSCTLLSCNVAWSHGRAYASVDASPGTFVTWDDGGAPQPWGLRIPSVVALAPV